MPDDEADVNSPSGAASPGPGVSAWRMADRLSEAECMELLASGGVGRLVFTSRYGPTALPVVYRIDGESIVLGTWDPAVFDEDLRTGIAHADYQVALEADQIDPEARAGWFVLAQGAAQHLVLQRHFVMGRVRWRVCAGSGCGGLGLGGGGASGTSAGCR